jgi:hypothetical protein
MLFAIPQECGRRSRTAGSRPKRRVASSTDHWRHAVGATIGCSKTARPRGSRDRSGCGSTISSPWCPRSVPALMVERPRLAGVHSHVGPPVAVRIDLAVKAFFRRRAAGEPLGSPRLRGRACAGRGAPAALPFPRWRWAASWTLKTRASARPAPPRPACGTGEGDLAPPAGRPPQAGHHPRSRPGKWDVWCSGAGADPAPLPTMGAVVGRDVGGPTVATLSPGEEVANPRFFRAEAPARAKVPRTHSTRTKGTHQGHASRARTKGTHQGHASRARLSGSSLARWGRGYQSAAPGGGAPWPSRTAVTA